MSLERIEVKVRASFACAKSITRVQLQQFINDVDNLWLELVRDDELALIDLVEHLVVDLSVERGLTHSHLVDHDAQGPQVHAWR